MKFWSVLFAFLLVVGIGYAQVVRAIAGNAIFSGQAATLRLGNPGGICTDRTRQLLYVVDTTNGWVIEMNPVTGASKVFAGSGFLGSEVNETLATSAKMGNGIFSCFVDEPRNAVYIVDNGNNVVRMVNRTTGMMKNIAGTSVAGFSGDGANATSARLSGPIDVVADEQSIYISDAGNSRIRKIDKLTGIISTFAGNGNPTPITDGVQATNSGLHPFKIHVHNSVLYIADTMNCRIRAINLNTNIITTVVSSAGTCDMSGDGGSALNAGIKNPNSVRIDGTFMYISGSDKIRRVDMTTNTISTFAGTGINGFSGDGGSAIVATFNTPYDVTFTETDVFVADRGNSRIRKINKASGNITTFSGVKLSFEEGLPASLSIVTTISGISVDVSDRNVLYIADQASRVFLLNITSDTIRTIAGNGRTGTFTNNVTGTESVVAYPTSVANDENYVYIAAQLNFNVRALHKKTNIITSIVGTGSSGFTGDGSAAINARIFAPNVMTKANEMLYITTSDYRIRAVNLTSGNISTIAGTGTSGFTGDGGSAKLASIGNSQGSTYDSRRNALLFSDASSARIRSINLTSGNISTIAGTGVSAYAGDGGLATAAQFRSYGLFYDHDSDLLVFADNTNFRVRTINRTSGIILLTLGTGVSGALPLGNAISPFQSNVASLHALAVDRNRIYFSDTRGALFLYEECVAGTFIESAKFACTSCPLGGYSTENRATNCTACAIGYSTSSVGSTSSSSCVLCAAGTYSMMVNGFPVCTPCAVGQYSIAVGATSSSSCQLCPAGTYSSTNGASQCLACRAGTYNSNLGSTSNNSCVACVPGTYSTGNGSSSCTPCQAGKYSLQDGASNSSVCLNCNAGTFSNQGSSACTSCIAGSYAAIAGSASCTLCAAGSFNNQTMSTSCSLCMSGTFSSTNSTSCTPCAIGSFSSQSGSATCSPCAAGYISNTIGSTQCSACAIGTHAPTTGTSTCLPCQAGTFGNTTAAVQCTLCNPGYFSSQLLSTSCVGCDANTFAATGGSTSCTPCQSGFTSPANATSCTAIPAPKQSSKVVSAAISLHGASLVMALLCIALLIIAL